MTSQIVSKFIVEMKIEPKAKADQDRLMPALRAIEGQDPLLCVSVDAESGEIILRGQNELHLDLVVDRLIRVAKIDINTGAPQVAYRETPARAAECDYTHKKQIGTSRQYARIALRVEPLPRDSGNVFESAFVDHPDIDKYSAGVRKGVSSVWENGVLIGFAITDSKVTWIDGAIHETDSSSAAFEVAARAAMKEVCEKAGIRLLEPIMDVEVVTPSDFAGAVLRDFDGRRSQIRSQEMRGEETAFLAFVPLANMFGYSSSLKSLSNGQASYTMKYSHYDFVPLNRRDDPDNFPPAVGMRA